ncbi:MAG TPA: hypothetical protein PK728_07115 [Bacillota bacterium]|nr:hypothetical protein [Bacillota bacterium]
MIYGHIITLEPVVHGSIPEFNAKRPKGAPLEFNRINIAYPLVNEKGKIKYEFARIPVISGNSVRGQGRRRFIAKTLEALETPERSLHPMLVHLLASGGSTSKGQTTPSNQYMYKTEMRKNMPFIDLLGGSVCGMFLKGMLKTGMVYPVVKETSWMLVGTPLEAMVAEREHPAAGDVDSRIFTIRMCKQSVGDELQIYSAGAIEEEIEEFKENGAEENNEAAKIKGAIFSAEALPAGVPLFNVCGVRYNGNNLLDSALNAFVETLLEIGTLGGYIAKGCGRVNAEYFYGDGTRFDPSKSKMYWEHLRAKKNEINEYMIKEFPKIIKASDEATEKEKERQEKSKQKQKEEKQQNGMRG